MIKGFNLEGEQRNRTYVAKVSVGDYVIEIPSVGDTYSDQDGLWVVSKVEAKYVKNPPTVITEVTLKWSG